MEKKDKMMMFVPITFEEACDEFRKGVSDMVYLDMETRVGYSRLLPIREISSTSLENWLKGTYYKKIEAVKCYYHAHPDDLEE